MFMYFVIGLVVFAAIVLFNAIVIVPQRSAYIVEHLGKYQKTLEAGFHLIIPMVDRISYRRSLKEVAIDVPPQHCITKDNITVDVDGILYLQVMDPVKASYGIDNYLFACVQLAQTTMRSEIGKLELDRTFEERGAINNEICDAVDKASDPWGIKITRYEIKSITPPRTIQDAMEKQMRAEREKRAMIAESEGERQARINRAEGEKQEAIAKSEGERARRINEADGKAKEITLIATATAQGLHTIAEAITDKGGQEAVNLRLAEQYIGEFGRLAKTGNTMIIPSDLSNVAGFIKAASSVLAAPTK